MRINYVITLFILTSLLSCNTNNEVDSIIINPNKFIDKEIKLSDFAEDIKYIPLLGERSIRLVYSTVISIKDSLLCIAVSPTQLCMYDIKGNFLYDIGKAGRGPGEYKYHWRFSVDKIDNKIYVLDKKKILIYSIKGNYIRSINLSKLGGNFSAIECEGKNIFLFENINCGYAKYNWCVINKEGKLINAKLNSMPRFKSGRSFASNLKFRNGSTICYWNSFNDTIFSLSRDDHNVRYKFANEKFRVSKNNADNLNVKNIFTPTCIQETQDYLFINYFSNKKSGLGMLDKSKKTFYNYKHKTKTSGGALNDLDGGLNLEPRQYLLIDNNEYLSCFINAYELKEHVASKAFKNTTPKYPEKKKQLIELANSLKENDNPVLMLVKLKK